MPDNKQELLARMPKIAAAAQTEMNAPIKRPGVGPTLPVMEAAPDQPHLSFTRIGTQDELKAWWDQYCSGQHLLHSIRDAGDAVIGAEYPSPIQLRFTGSGQYRSADTWKFDVQVVGDDTAEEAPEKVPEEA
jgi:hypothetical protein